MSEQKYEYYYEVRTKYYKVPRWSRERGTYWEEIENPEWSDWRDASGYNKKGSVYSNLSHIKGNLTRSDGFDERDGRESEYRYFRRPISPPPSWEPCDLEGNSV